MVSISDNFYSKTCLKRLLKKKNKNGFVLSIFEWPFQTGLTGLPVYYYEALFTDGVQMYPS